MSNQNSSTGFAAATEDSRELPKLACLGFVEAIGTAKVSSSKLYIVQPIVVGATQAGVKSFVNFLYRPEWLRSSFSKAEVDALAGAKKADPSNTAIDVYRMHVSADKGVSTLAGIAGSPEAFGELAQRTFAALDNIPDEEVMGTFENLLREFVNDITPTVGYYSSQKKEKDETGKKVPVPGKREVSGWFYSGSEADKYHTKAAAQGKMEVRYEI